jgi:hypothetical protein
VLNLKNKKTFFNYFFISFPVGYLMGDLPSQTEAHR